MKEGNRGTSTGGGGIHSFDVATKKALQIPKLSVQMRAKEQKDNTSETEGYSYISLQMPGTGAIFKVGFHTFR